jgi:hypothetical protein
MPAPAIDPIRARRDGTGLRAYDPSRCHQGYTLFTPMNGDGSVYLIDMKGSVVHTWPMPHPPGLYGHLLENGNLLYNGKILDDLDRFPSWGRWKGGVVLEADWSGRVLWEVRHPDHHHDACKLRNGNVLLLCLTPMPQGLIPLIQGGLPDTEADGRMYADYLLEVTTEGEEVWRWNSWEHLDPNTDRITPQDRRCEWTHGNTVAEMPNGDILISLRNISTVAIVERATGKLTWKLGSPPLAQQHDPKPLANGNFLIFDNGAHRVDHPLPYSRVIEVDPKSKNIVWTYQEETLYYFFSPYISGAQRLDNGNTLICEGNFGRLFEVTQNGDLVWEYVSPHFHRPKDAPNSPPTNAVFRAFRYTAAQLPHLYSS